MKSPLRKLQGFGFSRHNHKEKKEHHRPPAKLDEELVHAAQEVQEMRDCYDSLLTAAAATTNSVYEFSEALEEMGTCLLAKTSLNDDEHSGRVLMMLGKAQFELQKLVDSYRTNIVQTITTPSESLLKELQIVEEMKRHCDDKRDYYKFRLAAHREKGRQRHAKTETVSSAQVQEALHDYEEDAALLIFRLKSLKQGQFRSLLTQAARHHAAQLTFFSKGLKYLEALEPHVKAIAEQQHIDYHFSGLEDDDSENDNDDDSYQDDQSEDGELSFGYGINDQDQDAFPIRLMELDQVNHTVPPEPLKEHRQGNVDKSQVDLRTFRTKPETVSLSASIFTDNLVDPDEKIKQMKPPSIRQSNSYALPTPVNDENSLGSGHNRSHYTGHHGSKVGATSLWHSSPLVKGFFTEGNIRSSSPVRTPSPAEGQSPPLVYPYAASEFKKKKREAFSGPIPQAWSIRPAFMAAGHRPSMDPHLFSGRHSSVSPKVSPTTLHCPTSSPKISELHELPRPPVNLESTRPSGLVGYSGPLISRHQVRSTTSRISPTQSRTASPLPAPPASLSRSYSIPSSSQRMPILTVHKLLGALNNSRTSEQVASPPLMPLSLTNVQPELTGSELRMMEKR